LSHRKRRLPAWEAARAPQTRAPTESAAGENPSAENAGGAA